MVLAVLVKTIDGVRDKASYRYEQRCGQSHEHGVGLFTEIQVRAEAQTDVEARAHEARKQGHYNAFGEVEVLNGLLLFFLAERLRLHVAGHSDDGDARKRDHHAHDYRRSEVLHVAGEHGSKHCSKSGARAEGDTLAESHAEITHRQAERKPAYAPQHAEEHRQKRRLRVGGIQLHKPPALRNGEQRAHQREHKPRENALHKPVRLPAPRLYLVDRHVATRLAERAYRNND